MASSSHHLVWFRRDLRLGDNPAWSAAQVGADEITALFVVDPGLFERAGRFRRAALVAHLDALDRDLREHGGRLRLQVGDPIETVSRVVRDVGASRIHWNSDTTPYAVRRDDAVAQRLSCEIRNHWGTLVHEPGRVLTRKGTLSKVFTPFYKVWDRTPMRPWAGDEDTVGTSDDSDHSGVDGDRGAVRVADEPGDPLPRTDEASNAGVPVGGEHAARGRLMQFLEIVDDYPEFRDLPAVDGTSRLSSDLRFGTISPREVATTVGEGSAGRAGFVRQLAWRDWYAHLLAENPTMADRAIRPEYDKVAWRDDADEFEAWKDGKTGYPIVDAGMRQLSETGWMHNRVRMIAGSFLVKNLLIDWRRGERWFRHQLIDADVAQNAGNWQWVAGCGTDAAPYFRIFNPWTQSAKFDPRGDYIRRWVPELAGLGADAIHEPHLAAPLDLAAAAVVLGETYPHPIVDHGFARERALAAYKSALG